MTTPDIGDLFTYRGERYVAEGWAKNAAPPEPHGDERDPVRDALHFILYEVSRKKAFCARADADYVIGRGIAGCLAPIAEVVVTGRLDQHERVQGMRTTAERFTGMLLR